MTVDGVSDGVIMADAHDAREVVQARESGV